MPLLYAGNYYYTNHRNLLYCISDMVVSGIPLATPFHAREVADMSLDLVAACRVFTIPHMPGEPLKIRVGLHSGIWSSINFVSTKYITCILGTYPSPF